MTKQPSFRAYESSAEPNWTTRVSDAQVSVNGAGTCWDECRPTGAAAFVAEKLNDATQDDCSRYTPLSHCAMELLREVRVLQWRTTHSTCSNAPPPPSLSRVSSLSLSPHTFSAPLSGVRTTITHLRSSNSLTRS